MVFRLALAVSLWGAIAILQVTFTTVLQEQYWHAFVEVYLYNFYLIHKCFLDRQSSGSEYIQELLRTNWPNLPTCVGTYASLTNPSYIGTYQKPAVTFCSGY